MKLSVSVPDELWEKARRRVDDDSPSAVVQSALSRLVAASASTEYQIRPQSNDIDAALEAARIRVVADAREMFQDGYRKGLEFAAELGFRELDWIVQTGAVEAAKAIASEARPRIDGKGGVYVLPVDDLIISPQLLMRYLGSYGDPFDAVEWIPSRPTTEGIDTALHDVWQRVTETVDMSGGDTEAPEQL